MQNDTNDSGLSAERGRTAQQPAAAALGAPPSNTAPSNCIVGDSDSRILLTGVDSLYLSYAGS